MNSALKKEYPPVKAHTSARLQAGQIITSDKFRSNIQQISELQRKRDLIFALQEILVSMSQPGLSRYEYANYMQHFFEEIIFAETGLQSVKQGLRMFVDRLYAEPVITKVIYFVFKEMQKFMNLNQLSRESSEPARISAAMQEILNWYIERSFNIENLPVDEPLSSNYDRIFNLKVFHDCLRHNYMGFEVLAGLVLYGRAGQNLWFKVFVRENGEYVLPHVEWNSWIDDTEIFTSKPLDEDVALSGIIPLLPQTQRLIIDRLNIFIPYAALDLTPGKHEVEIETCLFNEKGDRLLSASVNEVVSVSRNYKNPRTIISEQALGIWSKDYITGDSISDLQVKCVQPPFDDMIGDLIKIDFDFEIYDRLGQSLFIEVRFYNSNGALIKSSYSQDKDQFMALRNEILADEIVYRCLALELVIPRVRLNIDDEDLSLSCEVCILSNENKVLCGIVSNFTLPERKNRPVLKPQPAVKPAGFMGLFSRWAAAKK